MKKKLICVLALAVALLCLFTACKNDGPGVVADNDEKEPNIENTVKYDDSYVVVMHGENEASVEDITYYFENGVYKKQSAIIKYSSEDAAKIGFNPVSTYENSKLEGDTVYYDFISTVFEGMEHADIVNYWEKQFDTSHDFYKNYTVKVEKSGSSQTQDPNAEKDTMAVQLKGESDAASESVTYYFINNVYTSQHSEITYATEDDAKANFPMVSEYDGANIDGKTITYNFVSNTFKGMTREEVVKYWEDQFKAAGSFYANYTVSMIEE